ncbi:MAG: lipoprotein signal peptidase [Cyclobacteriaceae bacterium]|nr:lipoprotein signal peptidase [Cyclobacteriaceae bacterium]
MSARKYFLIALVVIIIDQASKLLVYNYMYLHEEINVIGEWFKLHYLLNPGMAFGIRWENEFGKLALTIFRIAAMIGIGYYLYQMTIKKAHSGFLISMALILGGAVGNVIDSTFYGVFLGNQPIGSYSPWFHGQVIDMLFFPIFDFMWPEWVPMVGGEYFLFFSPVFNIADSSIFIGVATILIFQKRFFKESLSEQDGSVLSETNNDENRLSKETEEALVNPSEPVETTEEEKPQDINPSASAS